MLLTPCNYKNLYQIKVTEYKNKMPKRFPEWVNTEVVIKAIKKREEGMLSKQLNLWIENLLEIEKK